MSAFLSVWMAVAALLWGAALARAVRARRTQRYRVGLDHALPAGGLPPLFVVVPARDEAADIGRCVASVLADPHARMVVIDDDSTDGTGEILAGLAREHPQRLVLVEGGGAALPEGWLGKAWACQRAGRVARDSGAEWLLFVDADVILAPGAPSAALAYALEHDLAMLSGFGQLELRTFWEKVVQPAVVGMIIAGNDLGRTNDPARRRGPPLANGQFLLLRRDAYEAVGGHAAVRDNVIDDVGMATAITGAGFAYQLVFMRALFRVRMYDSLRGIWQGWTKNLFPGLGRSWGVLGALVTFNLLFVVAPYVLALAGLGRPWGWWALLAVALVQALRALLDDTFDQPLVYGLTHVLGQVVLVALLLNSALQTSRGKATWKGRRVG